MMYYVIPATLLIGLILGFCLGRRNIKSYVIEIKKEQSRLNMYIMLLGEWLFAIEKGKKIENYFLKRNITSIAIYGMSILGNHMVSELSDTQVKVKYIVDRSDYKGNYDCEVCKPDKKLEGIDAIVVTPIHQFDEIKADILKNNDIKVISIRDILTD